MPRASRPLSASRRSPRAADRWRRGSGTTAGCCSRPIAPSARPSGRSAPSPRRPNGWSTTSTSSRSRSARSATIFPRGFYRQLPKLAEGPLEGYPRVFGLAWAFVAHTDSRFDPEIAAPVRARLPARAAADDRRALGGGDHAAHRARREPAARSPSGSCAAGRRARRPTPWPTGCWASAARRPGWPRRPCGASRSGRFRRLRGAAGPAAARSGSGGDARRCAGWTNAWPPRERPPTRSSARSISGRAR